MTYARPSGRLAGPAEATALGNAIVQFIALGELASTEDGRKLAAASFPLAIFEPEPMLGLQEAISRFDALVQSS